MSKWLHESFFVLQVVSGFMRTLTYVCTWNMLVRCVHKRFLHELNFVRMCLCRIPMNQVGGKGSTKGGKCWNLTCLEADFVIDFYLGVSMLAEFVLRCI